MPIRGSSSEWETLGVQSRQLTERWSPAERKTRLGWGWGRKVGLDTQAARQVCADSPKAVTALRPALNLGPNSDT